MVSLSAGRRRYKLTGMNEDTRQHQTYRLDSIMDILDFKKHLRSRRHDADVIKLVRSHVIIKPKWTWRRIKEDGTVTEATRGNTTDPLMAGFLGQSWMAEAGTNSKLPFPGTIEVRNQSGQAIFKSNLYSVSSPIGGPYTALTEWPAGGEFLGYVARNQSPLKSGTITTIVLLAGKILASTTQPTNWSTTSDSTTLTMPNSKRLAELWEFHLSMDVYMDGVKSVRMWDLLAGQIDKADNKHFGIATGGSELQVSRVGTGGTVGNAQGLTTVAVADSIVRSVNDREVKSKWTIDGSQLTGLNLGASAVTVSLKPTFGKSPAEVFYGNDTIVQTDLTNSSVKELEVTTTFGTSYSLNINYSDHIYIPDGQDQGTATVTVYDGQAPFAYWVVSQDRPGGLYVSVSPDVGATATVTVDLESGGARPADGDYSFTIGVRDDDGNTDTVTFQAKVGQEGSE